MKNLESMSKFLRNCFVWFLSLGVASVYLFWIFSLKERKVLEEGEFISNITTFFGWIIALLIGFAHLHKSRKDNEILKRDEVRKTLEIDAFREINKATSKFSGVLVSAGTPYYTLPAKLQMHIDFPEIAKFDKNQINVELNSKKTEIYGGTSEFITSIEANEISVIEFDHYRKFIQFRIDDLHVIIQDFLNYFNAIQTSELITKEGFEFFKEKCFEVSECFGSVQCYLFDYRILLMNSALGEVFNRKVPDRKPLDPRYKTLKELVNKKDIELEEKRRLEKILNKK